MADAKRNNVQIKRINVKEIQDRFIELFLKDFDINKAVIATPQPHPVSDQQ